MTHEQECNGCAAKRKMRSLYSLAVGGTKIGLAALGLMASSEETIEQRKAACLQCEHYDFGVCEECGCFLAAKVALKTERCPKGKW